MASVLRAHCQNRSSKQVGEHGEEKPGRAGVNSQPCPHILPPWLRPCQSYAYSVFALFLRQRHARLLLPLCCLQQTRALSHLLVGFFSAGPPSSFCEHYLYSASPAGGQRRPGARSDSEGTIHRLRRANTVSLSLSLSITLIGYLLVLSWSGGCVG